MAPPRSKPTHQRFQLGLTAARAHRLRLAFPTGGLCNRDRRCSRGAHGRARLQKRRAFLSCPSPPIEGGEKNRERGVATFLPVGAQADPVDLLPLGVRALSEQREARRLGSASARERGGPAGSGATSRCAEWRGGTCSSVAPIAWGSMQGLHAEHGVPALLNQPSTS